MKNIIICEKGRKFLDVYLNKSKVCEDTMWYRIGDKDMKKSHFDNRDNLKSEKHPDYDEKENVFIQINHHLLEDECPSNYLNDLSHKNIFKQSPFSMLLKLKETMQSPIYHPEGNAWNHTILVVNEAAKIKNKSKDEEIFMWAALLHDIGKPSTTRFRKSKITAYDHDVVGADLAREFLQFFYCPEAFTNQVVKLIRWHMHILYVLKDLPFSKIEELKSQVDINELALLGYCDRVGRQNADRKKEEENIQEFILKVK